MYVLYVLSFMIERAGSEINPLVGALSSYLPALWQECEEHNMLRCAIISTLVHLEKVHFFILFNELNYININQIIDLDIDKSNI